ncbi:hypothetical protein A6F68_02520 [Tsuneonella dongtanensis]|uniref:DUF3500 domain-containing protein n=1 Tax=Tsuneonella dongtanensis TaxID=692370 RepID=A0A1B2AFV9_9SPHN|nr:DUF3500 domain-containing protein [Tsuneonella dongtanensis]ANY21016.1 hypothetical protein A6F68_02520 [Tsuneonella dongtanensis]
MKALTIPIAVAALLAVASTTPVSGHVSPGASLEDARVRAMRDATTVFIASLDEAQRASVLGDLDDTRSRTSWSNLPVSMAPRSGLSVADMTSAQRVAFHAMMAAALSSQGYLKTATIMWHEDVLRGIVEGTLAAMPDGDPPKAQGLAFAENYDTEKFFVKIFGNPGDSDWGWLVTGHHFAATFTVSGGKIAFTPMFLGANPQVVPQGRYAGWRLLQHEADRALALLGSLDAEQLKRAVVSGEVDAELFAGPGNQDSHKVQFGIKASELDPLQRNMLQGLLNEYLGDASDEAAARQRDTIEADGLETLRFAWWGPTDAPSGRYMFRVQGPSVVIDYIRESSGDGQFNHVHSILRDPSNDYGADWLKRHYDEAHGR